MEKFINTKKEQFLGFDFLKNHTLPSRDVFDYRVHKKEYSEYFAQYGFQVSMVYADFYSRMWCSDYNDRYMSDDVYYYYVIPCLNRFDFINSYMDKNGYDRLFPDIKKPSILMKNINGRFFSPDDMPISTEEAVKLVLATDLDCIIKPSIDSGSGKNVKLVRKEEIDTAKVKDLFETYKWDFNIQKRLEQSATLKKQNESSLNTLRIYTYRTLAGEYVLLVSVVRFGGKGAFNDNASTGGGFCHVYDDGSLDQRVLRYHTLDKPTLKEFLGFESLTIPNYDRVMKFVFDLHRRLPYFDLVGWDIALDVNNEPVFIEMNLTAESGFAQMNGGPLFGKYLDEVMERVSKVHKDYRNSVEMKFENGSRLMMKV